MNVMNVSSEVLEFVMEKGIIEKFFREVLNYKKNHPNYHEPINCMASGFDWRKSEDGHDYWLNLDLEFRGVNK